MSAIKPEGAPGGAPRTVESPEVEEVGPAGQKATETAAPDPGSTSGAPGAQTTQRLGTGQFLESTIKARLADQIGSTEVCEPALEPPPQTVGRESNAGDQREYATEEEAEEAYQRSRDRLIDVSKWNELSGWENATFELHDEYGNPVSRVPPQPGDYIKVDLPGPGGDDWVRVEEVRDTEDSVGLTVRPSHDPTEQPPNPDVTKHFFTKESTNTFSVERRGTQVVSQVRGRNEVANTGDEAGGTLASARNWATANGAWGVDIPGTERTTSLQQHQWNVFTENLLEDEPPPEPRPEGGEGGGRGGRAEGGGQGGTGGTGGGGGAPPA